MIKIRQNSMSPQLKAMLIRQILTDISKDSTEGLPIDLANYQNNHDLNQLLDALIELNIYDGEEEGESLFGTPKLKPGLTGEILHLLLLMSLGNENAITKLATMLINSPNKQLLNTLAKSMEKGIPGATTVFSKVLHQAPEKTLTEIRKNLTESQSQKLDSIPREQLTASPFAIPKPKPD